MESCKCVQCNIGYVANINLTNCFRKKPNCEKTNVKTGLCVKCFDENNFILNKNF